jgi:hypothetical protein
VIYQVIAGKVDMSHRYRSHCCCGAEPDRVFECFLGYGTVPHHPFRPGAYNGVDCECGGSESEESCSYSNTPYDNRYDNWSFCAHTMTEEVIVSLERDIVQDVGARGAYAFAQEDGSYGDCTDNFPDPICHELYWPLACSEGFPSKCDYPNFCTVAESGAVNICGFDPDGIIIGTKDQPCKYVTPCMLGPNLDQTVTVYIDCNCPEEGPGNPCIEGESETYECGLGDVRSLDCDLACRDGRLTQDVESTATSVPNRAMYARYKRLQETITSPKWSDHFGDVLNRPYVYYHINCARALAINEIDPNHATVTNGGHRIYPLYINPNSPLAASPSYPLPDPGDPYNTHGNAAAKLYTQGHCAIWDESYSMCGDVTASIVPNINEAFNPFMMNFDYKGLYGIPLTYAQSMLIGEDWDTSKWGYIPPVSKVRRDYACDGNCPDLDSTEETPLPYNRFGASLEYGPEFFWLQGIANHHSLHPERKFRHFIWHKGVTNLIQEFSNEPGTCEDGINLLWDLNETLFAVFHRESWYSKYFNGFGRTSFRILHGVPLDGDEYSPSMPDPDYFADVPEHILNDRSPGFVGFSCAGCPVFSWEVVDLYIGLEGTPRVPDSVLNQYNIDDVYNQLLAYFQNSPDELQTLTTYGNSQRRKHFAIAFIAGLHGFAFPTQITDLFEKYGILPDPQDHGISADYKIFKKKLQFYTGEGSPGDNPPDDEKLVQCCSRIPSGDDAPTILYGNCGLLGDSRKDPGEDACPYLREIEQILNDPGRFDEWCANGKSASLCDFYPEWCESIAGCVYSPCQEAVCANDSSCCDEKWDQTCIDYAETLDECKATSICITVPKFICEEYLLSQVVDDTKECPSILPFYQDVDNSTFCSGPDGTSLGSCCRWFGIDGGVKSFIGCTETTESNCVPNFEIIEWTPYGNCWRNALCGELDENIGTQFDACREFGGMTSEDYYFYGRQGGWTWISNGENSFRGGTFSINSFPSHVSRENPSWSASQFPIKFNYTYINPMLDSCNGEGPLPPEFARACCAECHTSSGLTEPGFGLLFGDVDTQVGACCTKDGGCLDNYTNTNCNALGGSFQGVGSACNDGTTDCSLPGDNCENSTDDCCGVGFNCIAPLFTSCTGRVRNPAPQFTNRRPPVWTGRPFGRLGTIDAVTETTFPTSCSNESFTETCRGCWWQAHTNDYENEEFGEITPNSGYRCQCDSVNNAFFLRTDPYLYGENIKFEIKLDNEGITFCDITPDEIILKRGRINRLDLKQVFNSDTFNTPGYTLEIQDCDNEPIIVNVTSTGLKFAVSGSNDRNDEGILRVKYDSTVRYDELANENFGIIEFNPLEQLDRIEETKCPDTLYYQIYETMVYTVPACGPDDPYQVYFDVDRPDIQNSEGLIQTIDGPEVLNECGQIPIKYTEYEARNISYQWYHPPYIRVTGQPARAYNCNYGDFISDFCDPCRVAAGPFGFGQCENTITINPENIDGNRDVTPLLGTKKRGPAGSDKSGYST